MAGQAARRRSLLPSMPDLVALFAMTAILLRGGSRVLNGDTAAHLAAGGRILATGAVPRTEWLSYTLRGEPLVLAGWLGDVVFAAADRLGGTGALVALVAALAALIYGSAAFFLRRRGADARLALLAGLLAFLVGSAGLSARPQLFSYLGVVALLFLIERERPAPAWAFALLFLAWANLHAGFVYGLGLLGLYLAGELAEGTLARAGAPPAEGTVDPGERWGRAPRLAAGLAAGGLAACVNPWGIGLYRQVGRTVGDRYLLARSLEYLPPSFRTPEGMLLAATLAGLAAILLLVRPRPRLPRLLAVLAFAALALRSVRHVPVFGLVALPLTALHLQERLFGRRGRGRYWLGDALARRDARTRPGAWALPVLALLLGVAASGALRGPRWSFDPATFPVAAARAVRDGRIGGRLVHPDRWGGYLALALPEHRVFLDPLRYDEATVRDYLRLTSLDPGWRGVLRRRDVSLAVLPPDAPLAEALRREEGWRRVYADSVAVVLRRSD